MSNPISGATEEKASAGKFNTETIIPEKFELTDEFKNTYNLINKTKKNLFSQLKDYLFYIKKMSQRKLYQKYSKKIFQKLGLEYLN